jgi:hypothetical protein
VLPDAARRSERELGFFLAGAEGHPFRGVTRSTVLTRRFPTNHHRGFAVETEWALHLVQEGVAVRSERPLYLKRQPARTDDASVTVGWRFGMTHDEQVAALEHNRARLMDAIGPKEAEGAPRQLVVLAAEAAMLRRWSLIPGEPLAFGEVQLGRAREVLDRTASIATAPAASITCMVHVALSRHHGATGDRDASLGAAQAAVRCLPTDKEACLQLAQLLLATGELDAAIDLLTRTADGAPLEDGVLRLIDATTRVVGQRYAATAPEQPPSADRLTG